MNYDRQTLWAFKISDLKSIMIANDIPKTESDGKRGYVNDILKFQGNYEEEMQNIELNRNAKKDHIDKLLLMERTEKSLKKLKIDDLLNMLYKLRVPVRDGLSAPHDEILAAQNLKGNLKRNALIALIVHDSKQKSISVKQSIVQESTKYEKYYVYPGHWFRTDYETIDYEGLSNVKCSLCYKTTGIFRKQFNVCQDCHLILQKDFCRRYLWLYNLTTDILPHHDILSYFWNILKYII
jgi:hypothetical protein